MSSTFQGAAGSSLVEVLFIVGVFIVFLTLFSYGLSRISPRKSPMTSLLEGDYEDRLSLLEKQVRDLQRKLREVEQDATPRK